MTAYHLFAAMLVPLVIGWMVIGSPPPFFFWGPWIAGTLFAISLLWPWLQ